MFTDDANNDTIQLQSRRGSPPTSLPHAAGASQAHPRGRAGALRADRALRDELKTAQGRLAERKIIEKAKGVVMQQKQIIEDDAYRLMRKLRWTETSRCLSLPAIAQCHAAVVLGRAANWCVRIGGTVWSVQHEKRLPKHGLRQRGDSEIR